MRTDPHSPTRADTRRCLVSGGAGFIGSHLVDLLLERGDQVTVVDNLSTGRRENLPEQHDRLRFVDANLSDALGPLARDGDFDEVYHLAAAVGVKLVMDDPISAIETNVVETAALLRFAVAQGSGGRPARVLIASSSEVYGKSPHEVFSEEDDVVYGPTTVARWSYAASKAIDEYLALSYASRDELSPVIVRFFNTVGPRQVGDYGMVLPRFVGRALRDEPLEVFGDGTQSRCFCDVRDVAGALPSMLASDRCVGRVLNLGSDRPITIRELAERVIDVTGSRSTISLVPFDKAYPAGFEDLHKRRPDLSRVREAIGFEPSTPLETTIRDIAAQLEGAHA